MSSGNKKTNKKYYTQYKGNIICRLLQIQFIANGIRCACF